MKSSNQPLSPIVAIKSPEEETPQSRGPQYDSLDYLEVSPSHFTLPSLTNSRECLDEEEAMDALVNKMQLIFPSNMSFSGKHNTSNMSYSGKYNTSNMSYSGKHNTGNMSYSGKLNTTN